MSVYRLLAAVLSVTTAAGAQSLTPEEILAQVEERVAALNPYQALLNDPDPERSLAAMQVMLESRDATLMRLATEFGLLSPNSQVQRIALEGILNSGPVLTMRIDGTRAEGNFERSVRGNLNGTVTPEKIGFAKVSVGNYDEEKQCYLWSGNSRCAFTVNSEGVFLTHTNDRIRAALMISPEGMVVGTANISDVDNPVPLTIRLID